MTAIGRIIFAIPFLVFGAMHFPYAEKMAGMVPAAVPGGIFWIYFTGACEVAAGIAFITKFKGKLAAQLMAVLLLVFILAVHMPAMAVKPEEMGQVLKNLGLIGACLMLAGIFRREGQ